MNNNLEMIIFDLDGTLWEVTDTTHEAANEVMRRNGLNHEITVETIKNSMGCNLEECARNYMPNFEEEKRINLIQEINATINEKLLVKGGHLYPNLENILIELKKKYKLAIVSNCSDNYIETFLETSKLEKYFDDFMAASKMKIPKGEAIKRIIERNNIKNAIYVGDTMKDYEATIMAGIEFIHAKYGFAKNLEFKLSINEITELPQLLESI